MASMFGRLSPVSSADIPPGDRAEPDGGEQVPAAEHVERQIAPAIVIAVEEPALLVAVQGIVGRVEVENDLRRRLAVRVEEQLDEQPLDRRPVMADPVVARRPARRRMFHPVERALAGKGRTVRPTRLELAGEDRHRRVVPQPIMVDQVLIAQHQAKDPLADQCHDLMLDPGRRAPIAEAAGEPLNQPNRLVSGTEQQRSGIRGHCAAVEGSHDPATLHRSKAERRRATICRHRGTPLHQVKSLSQNDFPRSRAPMHLPLVRNPG